MKAIVVVKQADGPVLSWQEVADVSYGPDEVLVDVRASAVNRADLAQARGAYPPPPGVTEILGLEMAGVISAIGESVTSWAIGDRVCALLPGGGYAEQVAVNQDMLLRLPDHWSFDYGAAIPEAWFTAYVNLFLEGELQAGETVLIHAGASGVGTAAIQLARQIGVRVIVTAGSQPKLDACRALGADTAINYKKEVFSEIVMSQTGGEGVDVILDPVGGPYLSKNCKILKQMGRLVNIGLLGGAAGELDMGQLLGKRLRIIGSRLRNRPLTEKIEITRQFEKRFWPLFPTGSLKPIIDSVFPMPKAQDAHRYVELNRNTGKVILSNE